MRFKFYFTFCYIFQIFLNNLNFFLNLKLIYKKFKISLKLILVKINQFHLIPHFFVQPTNTSIIWKIKINILNLKKKNINTNRLSSTKKSVDYIGFGRRQIIKNRSQHPNPLIPPSDGRRKDQSGWNSE